MFVAIQSFVVREVGKIVESATEVEKEVGAEYGGVHSRCGCAVRDDACVSGAASTRIGEDETLQLKEIHHALPTSSTLFLPNAGPFILEAYIKTVSLFSCFSDAKNIHPGCTNSQIEDCILWHPANGNTPSRKLSGGSAKMGAAAR